MLPYYRDSTTVLKNMRRQRSTVKSDEQHEYLKRLAFPGVPFAVPNISHFPSTIPEIKSIAFIYKYEIYEQYLRSFGPCSLHLSNIPMQCPVSPSSNDAQAIMFGLSLQNLLTSYYAEVPINASFYPTLPSTMPVTDFLTSTMGIVVKAKLGMQGLQELASAAGTSMPSCSYTFPPVTDAKSDLVNAYNLEATMCGAFIGLADYVQSSQAAFLMARLAAEHG